MSGSGSFTRVAAVILHEGQWLFYMRAVIILHEWQWLFYMSGSGYFT